LEKKASRWKWETLWFIGSKLIKKGDGPQFWGIGDSARFFSGVSDFSAISISMFEISSDSLVDLVSKESPSFFKFANS